MERQYSLTNEGVGKNGGGFLSKIFSGKRSSANTPPEAMKHLEISILEGNACESDYDIFFIALEREFFKHGISHTWQATAARMYMDDLNGYYWDKAWLNEEEKSKGIWKPGYLNVRDRMMADMFPNSSLRNRILNDLDRPPQCLTARLALQYLKRIVQSWNRLRERNRRLSRLDGFTLKTTLFAMLPPTVAAQVKPYADDPDVSFPKFKLSLIPYLDHTAEDKISGADEQTLTVQEKQELAIWGKDDEAVAEPTNEDMPVVEFDPEADEEALLLEETPEDEADWANIERLKAEATGQAPSSGAAPEDDDDAYEDDGDADEHNEDGEDEQ